MTLELENSLREKLADSNISNSARIAYEYVLSNSDAHDSIMKATYAFHFPNDRSNPYSHTFTNGSRESKCIYCGRSREEVRWDNLPPRCNRKPEFVETSIVLDKEYDLYQKMIENGRKICLKKWNQISEINGGDLCWLKNTHGFGLEDVEGVYESGLTKKQKEDFEKEYELHCETGKLGEKKLVISVSNNPI